ncbi:MAG: PQQ-dependent sugar dehydrogenase [Meiothermus sp.]|nr:PQQ-dependent sugar dehydrogenase [Meiothermus sp.]
MPKHGNYPHKILILGGLLLLAACASSPRNAPPASSGPAAPAVGLLEVRISGLGGGSPVARAGWADGPEGVSPQAVTLAAELPGFTSRSVQVLDMYRDGEAARYVTAVLEVSNTTAAAFSPLALYALNQPGVTLGGTAFSRIETVTGAALSDPDFARRVRPAQAMAGAGLEAAVAPGMAHLQWLTPAEVQEVGAALPALGLSGAEPLQYAFAAQPGRIGPGERGFVALAFAFPRPQDRALAPDTLVLRFVVGSGLGPAVAQSLEEQNLGTVAGLAEGSLALAALPEARVLAGSRYAGANRRQLCRAVTAGSLSEPLAVLGAFPAGQTACAVAPVAPTLSSTEPGYHRLTLRWEPVLEATSYTLERGLGRTPESWTSLSPAGNRLEEVGLEAGTTYTYRLRSNNAGGSSDWAALTLTTRPAPFTQETVLENIGDIPWSLNFTPDGALLYTLRNQPRLQLGRLDLSTGEVTPVSSDPPIAVRTGQEGRYNEGGAMGMELDPQFADNRRLYVCYAYWLDGVQRPENRFVRVSRLELAGNALTNEVVMIDRIEGTDVHSGCRVAVHDGHLYASTGEGAVTEGSQRPDRLSGKILRVALDGTVPADNPDWDNDPTTHSPVWSIGHRNPQGLAFQPGTGLLWSTEHGPYTRDEINIIRPGRNYGWPHCQGTQPFGTSFTAREWGGTQTFDCVAGASPTLTAQNYQPALREYDPARGVAVSDLLFYQGAAFPQWRGDVLFVTLRTGRLYRMTVSGDQITGDEVLIDPPLLPDPLLSNAPLRLRDIAAAPDGTLYLSSDNGSIVRLRPR